MEINKFLLSSEEVLLIQAILSTENIFLKKNGENSFFIAANDTEAENLSNKIKEAYVHERFDFNYKLNKKG